MKEIRLHGRGGQGVVKASQIIVSAAVAGGRQGQFIPFFGVERKGSPVFGYLRLSDQEIRRKTQIYEPDMLVIMDDSLIWFNVDGIKTETSPHIIRKTIPLTQITIPRIRFTLPESVPGFSLSMLTTDSDSRSAVSFSFIR